MRVDCETKIEGQGNRTEWGWVWGLWGGRSGDRWKEMGEMDPGKWEGKVSQAETCKDKDGRVEKVCCGGEWGLEGDPEGGWDESPAMA